MQIIWKFETPINTRCLIKMPKDAKILCVQQDQKTKKPCIWALVDSDKPLEERLFELYGTGVPVLLGLDVERMYIGTYQLHNGEFVGHLFERLQKL